MKKKKGKRKISFLKVLVLFLVLYLGGSFLYGIVTSPIKNIYVIGNSYLSDKEIISLAEIYDYPSFFLTSSRSIKKKLEKDSFIDSVSVKKGFFSVYLYVNENVPLFYDSASSRLVLANGNMVSGNAFVPTLSNYVPDTLFSDLVNKMNAVVVRDRISEIMYLPNAVDSERFYLLMNDGNGVYLTLDEFLKINDYVDALMTLNGTKGTIYWDSGNFFEEK